MADRANERSPAIRSEEAALRTKVFEVVSTHLGLGELRKVADNASDRAVIRRISTAYYAVGTAFGFLEALMRLVGWKPAKLMELKNAAVQEGVLLAFESGAASVRATKAITDRLRGIAQEDH